MTPVEARTAIDADLPEVLRLVAQVYTDMHAIYGGQAPMVTAQWEVDVGAALNQRGGVDVAIFVVDGEGGRLASVAVGRVSETLPSPRRANRFEGYVEWVGTDPEYRRRGFASSATAALLEWFRTKDALSVSLSASPAAESLYLKMGFSDEGPRALSLRLEPRRDL